MQEVMQKRLAIVVMMVMTALKISLAVGFLLKNDIFTNFFLEFKIIIFLPHPSSPARRGSTSLLRRIPCGCHWMFFWHGNPLSFFVHRLAQII